MLRSAGWNAGRRGAAMGCALALLCSAADAGEAAPDEREVIYIGRSVRESRVAPTAFCERMPGGGAGALYEDRYTFRAVSARPSDGRVTDANGKTIGTIHACFRRTEDPAVLIFYGAGTMGGAAFNGLGECRRRPDYPAPGLTASRCFLDLSGLPEGYTAGMLTTNTVNSRRVTGMETDPAGYLQSSIATIRLWRK